MGAVIETGRHRDNGPPPAPRNEVVMHDVPYGYCHCGCGQRTALAPKNNTAKGHVKGQPMRYLPGHHKAKSPVLYLVDETTGCWVWQRTKDRYGYGKSNGRKAHRIFFERFKGPIPEGLTVDHLCRNRACVNPDHLEAVTHRENCRRSPLIMREPVDSSRSSSSGGGQ